MAPKYALSISDLMTRKYVFSISDFCFAHNISRTTFYSLLKDGKAPQIMRIGRRKLISIEAAEKWRNSHSNSDEKNKEVL